MSGAVLDAEDEGRAALYGLLARLFYAAPDAPLLAALAPQPGLPAGSPLLGPWTELASAWREAGVGALEDEFDLLFLGTGRAVVTPYLSHYLAQHTADEPLVELREHLARWGIARSPGVGEPEDHFAAVCETMRFAIAVQQRSIEEQKIYFDRYVYRGGASFCAAVSASEKAVLYRFAVRFARAFLELERQAFDIG